MLTLGIDLSTNPKKTACCSVDWTSGEVSMLDRPMSDDEVVAEMLRADVSAIDVPLGWPDGFVDALVAHRNGRTWPERDGDRAPLRLRDTDRAVIALGAQPLSVSADRIGAAAMRGAYLQSLLRSSGADVDRSGMTGTVVEAYPAAALAGWGLRSKGYKGAANAAALAELARDLLARCGPLAAAAERTLAGCDDDDLDAFVCALVARAARSGQTTAPDDIDVARREGWIHVPTVGVEELVNGAAP